AVHRDGGEAVEVAEIQARAGCEGGGERSAETGAVTVVTEFGERDQSASTGSVGNDHLLIPKLESIDRAETGWEYGQRECPFRDGSYGNAARIREMPMSLREEDSRTGRDADFADGCFPNLPFVIE